MRSEPQGLYLMENKVSASVRPPDICNAALAAAAWRDALLQLDAGLLHHLSDLLVQPVQDVARQAGLAG